MTEAYKCSCTFSSTLEAPPPCLPRTLSQDQSRRSNGKLKQAFGHSLCTVYFPLPHSCAIQTPYQYACSKSDPIRHFCQCRIGRNYDERWRLRCMQVLNKAANETPSPDLSIILLICTFSYLFRSANAFPYKFPIVRPYRLVISSLHGIITVLTYSSLPSAPLPAIMGSQYREHWFLKA